MTSAVTARDGLGARSRPRVVGPVVPGVAHCGSSPDGTAYRGARQRRRRRPAGRPRRRAARRGELTRAGTLRRAPGRAPTGPRSAPSRATTSRSAAAVLATAAARGAGRDPAVGARSLAAPRAGCCWRRSWPPPTRRRRAAACSSTTVDDLELIERALRRRGRRGDGRRLGAALRRERRARRAAPPSSRAAHGAAVEGELGGIAGDEDVAQAVAARALTDPAEAELLAATGADCLAVSIGNVHGTYRGAAAARLGAARRDPGAASPCRSRCTAPRACPTPTCGAPSPPGCARSTSTPNCARPTSRPPPASCEAVRDGARVMALHAAQPAAVEDFVASQDRRLRGGGRNDDPAAPFRPRRDRRPGHRAGARSTSVGRLGLTVTGSEEIPVPHVRLTYLDARRRRRIQLVEPIDPESAIAATSPSTARGCTTSASASTTSRRSSLRLRPPGVPRRRRSAAVAAARRASRPATRRTASASSAPASTRRGRRRRGRMAPRLARSGLIS